MVLREETEIIEGEVVEVQIDRPASGTVGDHHYLSIYILTHLLILFPSVL